MIISKLLLRKGSDKFLFAFYLLCVMHLVTNMVGMCAREFEKLPNAKDNNIELYPCINHLKCFKMILFCNIYRNCKSMYRNSCKIKQNRNNQISLTLSEGRFEYEKPTQKGRSYPYPYIVKCPPPPGIAISYEKGIKEKFTDHSIVI